MFGNFASIMKKKRFFSGLHTHFMKIFGKKLPEHEVLIDM